MTRLSDACFAAAPRCVGVALPAQAAVTITFWSHEFGNSFPHAFFTLRGIPDAGGAPVDVNYGFTAKTITPGDPDGHRWRASSTSPSPAISRGSDAQFSVTLTDAQYADVLALIARMGRGAATAATA